MSQRLFENTSQQKPLYFFEEISKIPRESGNEKAVSDYIMSWAKDKGFQVKQDEFHNLIIKKPASSGVTTSSPVILQAHLDMVCEKNQDSTHDFDHDPIPLQLDGDILMSAAGTTLGADDGIGVAYCMALLDSEDIVHPPLEVILTTEEETTFAGANGILPEDLEGEYLINLDHCNDREVLCASCGGTGMEVVLPYRQEQSEGILYQVTLQGLFGGHSGEDIHRGRGSAIELMCRLLGKCKEVAKVSLVDIESGSSRLAIPREAKAKVLVSADQEAGFLVAIEEIGQIFATEYEKASKGMKVNATKIEDTSTAVCKDEDFTKILDMLSLFPNGVQQMNGEFPGMVESSNNLGKITMADQKVTLTCEIRGAFTSTVEAVRDRIIRLANLFSAEYRCFDGYVPWEYRSDSKLRKMAVDTYKDAFNEELKPVVVHAGIECGFLLQKKPNLDAISLGPNGWYFHSPREKMSILSAQKLWIFLKKILKTMTEE